MQSWYDPEKEQQAFEQWEQEFRSKRAGATPAIQMAMDEWYWAHLKVMDVQSFDQLPGMVKYAIRVFWQQYEDKILLGEYWGEMA